MTSRRSRRIAIPLPRTRSGTRAAVETPLPPDLLREAVARLERIGLVVAALAAVVLVLSLTLPRAFGLPQAIIDGEAVRAPARALGIALALALAAAMRWSRAPDGRKLLFGEIALVLLTLIVALDDTAGPFDDTTFVAGVPKACLLIVLLPVLVPDRPRRTLLFALAAATTVPLAIGLHALATDAVPGMPLLVRLAFPGYACAAVAWLGARVVHKLGTDVERARRMGSYELVQLLGRGGMGEVWLARHALLARPAAIKLIRPAELDSDPGRAAMLLQHFRREAEATAALRSPHTVELYDFGLTEEGVFYYVMEHLEGWDLEKLVESTGPVPPERAVHLLVQACHSLAEAHACGLTHRDIKPANLFAARLGQDVDVVKVLDFGLVKARDVPDPHGAAGSDDALATGGRTTIRGTPATMAPEQIDAFDAVDGRADLYALGCVAWWLLTGSDVFQGTVDRQVLFAHLAVDPDPPSARAPQPIPPELDALVLACLRKDPAERPQTAQELARRLREVPVARPWTPERMAAWWAEHAPAMASAASTHESDALAATLVDATRPRPG